MQLAYSDHRHLWCAMLARCQCEGGRLASLRPHGDGIEVLCTRAIADQELERGVEHGELLLTEAGPVDILAELSGHAIDGRGSGGERVQRASSISKSGQRPA